MIRLLGNRILINILGFRLTIKNYLSKQKKIKNRLIPLGTNCYVRFKLSQYGVKPKKKKGEQSFPFDLSLISYETIPQVLKNNFSDYFNDIEYSYTAGHWRNTKYNIEFIHDKNKDKQEFIKRYENRIKNFKDTFKKENIVYITTVRNLEEVEVINNIYNILQSKSISQNFIYIVCNFKDTNNTIKLNKINQSIKYLEIVSTEEYWQKWWQTENDCIENNYKITKQFIDFIQGHLN